MKKHILILGLISAIAFPAAAEGVYIYGDLGQSKYTDEFDDTDAAFGLGLGYKLNKNFSVELGYLNAGGVNFSETFYDLNIGYVDVDAKLKISAIHLSALAKLPLNDSFDVYARLGYSRLKAKMTASAVNVDAHAEESVSKDKVIYGVGAEYQLNEKAALRAEYSKFGAADISAFTIGLTYAF